MAVPLVLGLLVVLLLACVLWIPRSLYPSLSETDLQGVSDAAKVQELRGARLKLQNDARTTLLQGLAAVLVLTGAGIGASVTLRQVRATRNQIRETATASRNQLKLSEQGQVTDRYTRAVEQLGHEKAPVRLGAMYSLDHLAQDNPEYRQTVVDVVCAYLRMPYTLPAQSGLGAEQVEEEMAVPANGGERAPHPAPGQDPAGEELQVRQTAQRLLANHLRCPPQTSSQGAQLVRSSPQQTFWPGISLDLTGATLVDFNFPQMSVIQAQFVAATFQGDARFDGSTFQGVAWFDEATFQDLAGFGGATFQRVAVFGGAHVLHFDNPDRSRRWPDGRPYRPDSTSTQFRKFVDQAGLPRSVHVHTLRHSAASFLAAEGVPVGDIAAQLGHADGGALALRIYVHPLEENKRRAAAHLDRIIGTQR